MQYIEGGLGRKVSHRIPPTLPYWPQERIQDMVGGEGMKSQFV